MGEEVKEFEEKLSKFFSREVVCVNTGDIGTPIVFFKH